MWGSYNTGEETILELRKHLNLRGLVLKQHGATR